jgi:hypothetical protein
MIELNKIDKKHKKNYWIYLLEKVKINILSSNSIIEDIKK